MVKSYRIYNDLPVLVSLYPCFNEVERDILVSPCLSVRPSVHLSVCGQNGVCSVSSTIFARSISYSHILLSDFGRCVKCKKTFFFFSKLENSKFSQILQVCNFDCVLFWIDFLLFWIGIQYESIVWIIMGWVGVSSECGHSSCFS